MKRTSIGLAAAAAVAVLAGCGGGELPAGVTEVSVTVYPATSPGTGDTPATQDLLTGGLGKSGIGRAPAPAYADATNPTVAELRRNTIYSNYRGLVDFTAAGGYGVFYGPNVGTDAVATAGEGLIPGREHLAVLDDGSGRKQVSLAVQVPDSFNPAKPCIVLGPSSGSRGVYGAIGTSAEWGLKRGCAVALTDAGKGVGLYDPTDDTVNRVDGPRATRAAAGALATFAANISDAARDAFNAAFPNRLSIKQAHSQQNPEKDWGDDTLVAAAYAFYVLNEQFGSDHPKHKLPRFHPRNTVVIAGSVSNGGAAVVRAAEEDKFGLIDGVVAGEPVTEMPADKRVAIRFAGQPVTGSIGRPLADYVTYGNLYQPCALLAAPALMSEVSTFNLVTPAAALGQLAALRCAGLAAKGLVQGATTAEQALDALNKLRAYGWTVEHDTMHNAHWGLGNGPILAAMYPMAYGRFGLEDNLCSTSFAQVNGTGDPIAVNPLTKALSFAVANGTANGTPATVVYNSSVGGAKSWPFAVSPSTGLPDFGLDNALCQRALVTGVDETGAPLTDVATVSRPTLAQSKRVQQGIAEVLVNGKLQRTPTLVVAGRSDALVPVNHNARAYASLNRVREGRHSQLRYIEVTNAQHFDSFLPFGGFDTRYVPLHLYWVRAMDAMWAHLTQDQALPPSQVVRTTPRGGAPLAAPALAAANVPPISAAPLTADRIGFVGDAIDVPQ